MGYSDKAVEALKASEAKLRDIIAAALQANAYGEVARVAHAVETVAALITELSGNELPILREENQSAVPIAALTPLSNTPNQRPTGRSSGGVLRKNQYPLFMRDGDRLVKVAWSKKERRPYEHRAPKVIIQALINAVVKNKGEGKLFEAVEVLPLHAENGEEYPSYQSYLALAWLRHIGVVTKKGREGYIIKRGTTAADNLAKNWEDLPIVA